MKKIYYKNRTFQEVLDGYNALRKRYNQVSFPKGRVKNSMWSGVFLVEEQI